MPSTKSIPKAVKKIFIVEDEGEMCLLLNLMLDDKEMELDHVQTIAAAREYLKKEQPSVIILDNKLPDGLGVDFINDIKKNYPAIKIIMISGFAATARDLALHNGADVFLEKPFYKEQLYKSILDLMN